MHRLNIVQPSLKKGLMSKTALSRVNDGRCVYEVSLPSRPECLQNQTKCTDC